MSYTSKFGYTNAETVGMTTNYAVVVDEPGECRLSNKTSPIDFGEVVSYKGSKVEKVSTNLDLPEASTKVRKGLQYVIKEEVDLRTTSSTDATFQEDDAIVMYLTVRHPASGFITADVITQAYNRLNQMLKRPDGSYRWDDLMRLALRPTE